MKNILTILISLYSCIAVAQKTKSDTMIYNGVYQSLYSYKYGQPILVKYKLYKGGGECNRAKEKFNFKKDSVIKYITADNDDYENTGYDKGHLANAEDFAFDCKKESLTFRYYNAVPQTIALNRGEWKIHEEKVRKMSQTDSLLIFCGGIVNSKCKNIKAGSKLKIPSHCYKLVISLTTHKVVDCVIFENNSNPIEKKIKIEELQAKTKFFDKYMSFPTK